MALLKSGSMKAVFTNYSYICIIFLLFFDYFPLTFHLLTLIYRTDSLLFD